MKRPVIVESNGGPRHCDAGLVRGSPDMGII